VLGLRWRGIGPAAAGRLSDAQATAAGLRHRHYENFPVASWLLPRRMRPDVAIVYAFARTADDFADEGDLPAAERQRLLDGWRERLEVCATRPAPPCRDSHDALFAALGETIRAHEIPLELFEDLLSAFRQDVTTSRYETWDQVVDYCRRSANPVGRIVLRIAGHRDARLDRASDALCTALQLTNFLQDLAIDWSRGRLYVPRADVEAAGASEADLQAGRIDDCWRAALSRVAARTRAFYGAGREIADAVAGRLRLELRLTWLGGSRILDRVEAIGFDVFRRRPRLGVRDVIPLSWDMMRWRQPTPGGAP
jgi:phytoene synthase